MASATNILLSPNKVFDLPQAGTNRVTRTLSLKQVGLFSVHTTGFVTRSDDLGPDNRGALKPGASLPLRGGDGGPGGGGGSGGGSTPHRTTVNLDWSLISPDGKTTLKPRSLQEVVITADLLARNRDAAGFSSGTWTLVLALPPKVDSITQIECSAMIMDMLAASESPPPILNVQQVLHAGETQSFEFVVDRVGDLTVAVNSTAGAQIGVELRDFANRVVPTGVHPFTLKDLHAARGGLWHLKLTAPATIPGGSANCTVLVQVVDTLRMPASVLQPRFDAILGNPNTGGAFQIGIDYNDNTKNVVSITISEDLYFTLDAFGYLDDLENARLALDRRSNPNAARVPLDPNVPYSFSSFDGGVEVHNALTAGMTIVVGNPGKPDGGLPTLSLTVPLVHNPGGKPTKIHAGFLQTLEIKQATITVDFSIGTSQDGGLTLTAGVRKPDIIFNLEHLPDPDKDTVDTGVQHAVQDYLASSLTGKLLQPIFTTLMGGRFTFLSAAWKKAGFEFQYVPPVEEPAHKVSPFYSARGTVPAGTAPSFTSPNLAKVDHIVVLLMENRSFDHVLGYLSLSGGRSDIDGLTPALLDSYSPALRPAPLTETRLPFDPEHSFGGVSLQMGNGGVGNQPMRGFALSFLEKYPFMAFEPNSPQRKAQDDPYWYAARSKYGLGAIMAYHTQQTLPVYAMLAKEYMICDRWHASHPGPTFPNRFYYLSGHLATDASGEPQRDNSTDSLRLLRSRTIQDALTERGISWKMYESGPDVCMLRMYARYAFDDTNVRPIEEFFASARAGTLPSVSFLEPNYHLGKNTDDDHPPTDMAAGQKFVQSIYAALTADAAAWAKTLFIVTYDEHGGLHDHHLPDLADRYAAPGRPPIDIGYGVRVPAFIISPSVPAGVTTRKIAPDAVFDHTSILKTIVNRFMPNDPAIMSDRMAFANDLFPLLTLDKPRPPVAIAMPADVSTAARTAGEIRAAARAMIAEARENNAPLHRGSNFFGSNVDWHEYMTHLALMLR